MASPIEDRYEDESKNQHNDEVAKIKEVARRIEANAKQFAQVEQEKRRLDATVAELKQAVLLRMEMDKCASSRIKNSILIEVKAKYIFPSCLIISAVISNHSKFCLENWDFMVNWCYINRKAVIHDSFDNQCEQLPTKPFIVTSKAIKLPLLAEGHQFETVIAIDAAFHGANVLLNTAILKTFFVDKQPRIIRIEMDSKILTSWDLITTNRLIFGPAHTLSSHERVKIPTMNRHSTTCFIPRKMLFLLTGKNAEPRDLFRFILPQTISTDCQTKFNGYMPNRETAVDVEVAIEKQDTGLTVLIASYSSSVAADLVESMKAKILLAFSRVWSEPISTTKKQKELAHHPTVESAWASLVEKFI